MGESETFTSWQVRLKTGFGPKNSEPLPTWRAPDLTKEEAEARSKSIESGEIPF